MIKYDKNQQTVEAYNKRADFYAENFDSYGIRIEDIDRAIRLNESDVSKLLEIGCGNGRDAQYIVSKVGKENYVGLDASHGLVRLARKKIPTGEFHVKDIRNSSFNNNEFGIIFTFATVLHLNTQELQDLLLKCHLWLKKGGVLYISTKYGEYREEKVNNLGSDKYYYFYQPEDIEGLISDKFFMVYKNIQDISGQSWFEIVLRKI